MVAVPPPTEDWVTEPPEKINLCDSLRNVSLNQLFRPNKRPYHVLKKSGLEGEENTGMVTISIVLQLEPSGAFIVTVSVYVSSETGLAVWIWTICTT